MDDITAQKILAINTQFYQTFAVQFSATRQRLQPGVYRLLEESRFGSSILDLGCGNGEIAFVLHQRGYTGIYTGLDFSQELLNQAALPQASGANVDATSPQMTVDFLLQDVTQPVWTVNLPCQTYSTILAFAVLHHLPGAAGRRAFFANVRAHLDPGGLFIHSNWQFLNSRRLRERIQPWEKAGLTDADVDADDYMLDWRSGGSGLRYVHHFSAAELTAAAGENGFKVVDTFFSDGESGNLGLYQLWQVV